jgi:hypothetical protein
MASFEHIPELIIFQDKSPFKESYGGSLDFGILSASLPWRVPVSTGWCTRKTSMR